MKKIAVIIALAGLVLTANAQLRLDNAKNYANPKKGYYDKAKIEIDAACEEDGTKNNAEVWAWKGWIYVNLGLSDKAKIKKVCPENWADIAYEAALKSKELNVDKDAGIITRNNEVFKIVAGQYVDEAFKLYNNAGEDTNMFRKSIVNVEKAIKIFQSSGAEDKEIKDRIKEARFLGGAAARVLGDNEATIKFFKPLVRAKYDKPYVYNSLIVIYQHKNDTVEALKMAKTYTDNFPNDYNSYMLAAKVYAWANKVNKAKENAQKAIDLAGNIEDVTAKSNFICQVADIYTDLLDYETATKEFDRAMQVSPNNPVVYMGLGRMHFNSGVDLQVKANDVPLDDATGLYEKLTEQFKAEYEESAKFYKKSLETNDRSTQELQQRYAEAVRNLKMVYARSNKDMNELKVYEQ